MIDLNSLFELYKKNPIITTDSRNCPKNSIFFAMKGANFNGNEFASKAIESGCEYAVVDEKQYANEKNIFYVEDCLKTLQSLASLNRERCKNTKFIGITGTNGKTTTKELIASVLQEKYNIVYTQGNFNNHLGVPLTLLRVRPEHKIAIIEMGANHPGEIAELVQMVRPNLGVITNIGKAHLEGFGSYEGVINTKKALYEFLDTVYGAVIVNKDDEMLFKLASSYKNVGIVSYGKENCFACGEIVSDSEFLSVVYKPLDQLPLRINTKLVGDYNFPNVMVAVTFGEIFNVRQKDIVKAIENYVPQNNRSQSIKTEKNLLIVDAYNANPSSMQASLCNFINTKFDNKMVILGDMKELGEYSKCEHENIVSILENSGMQNVVFVGPCFKEVAKNFVSYNDVTELISNLKCNPIKDSTILIKGSNSMKLSSIVEYL